MEQGKELSQFTAREWGVLLTRIRQHIDKTQPEMADLLNAGLTTYQKWEWGRRKPRAEYRRRIRKAFEEILYMWGILKREGEPESLIPLGGSEKQQLMEDDKTTESPVPVVAKHLQSSLDCHKSQELLIFGECLVEFLSDYSILFLCTLLDFCPVVPALDTLKHV